VGIIADRLVVRAKSRFIIYSLEIYAFFTLTGIFSTLLLPETMGRTLEELSNEKQRGFVRGIFLSTFINQY
jgi:hypothetical protein